ncbi:hypothetical protein L9F63_008890, partial [Diploptera punctata]
ASVSAICPTLRGPTHGSLSLHLRAAGGPLEAHFYCDEGYRLEGSATAVCVRGEWSHTLPVCTPVE